MKASDDKNGRDKIPNALAKFERIISACVKSQFIGDWQTNEMRASVKKSIGTLLEGSGIVVEVGIDQESPDRLCVGLSYPDGRPITEADLERHFASKR